MSHFYRFYPQYEHPAPGPRARRAESMKVGETVQRPGYHLSRTGTAVWTGECDSCEYIHSYYAPTIENEMRVHVAERHPD